MCCTLLSFTALTSFSTVDSDVVTHGGKVNRSHEAEDTAKDQGTWPVWYGHVLSMRQQEPPQDIVKRQEQ